MDAVVHIIFQSAADVGKQAHVDLQLLIDVLGNAVRAEGNGDGHLGAGGGDDGEYAAVFVDYDGICGRGGDGSTPVGVDGLFLHKTAASNDGSVHFIGFGGCFDRRGLRGTDRAQTQQCQKCQYKRNDSFHSGFLLVFQRDGCCYSISPTGKWQYPIKATN